LVEAVYVAVIALILWLGRDALLTQPVVMAAIALIGGLFLLWMGWQMAWGAWQNRLTLGGNAANQARVGLIPMGVFMSVSNPYWWIWWALIASLYVRQSLAWGIWGVFFLFIVHWLSDIGWLTCLAWLSGSGRNLISPRIYRWVLIGCGIILFFFGLFFVVTGSRIWATGNVDIL
jgi:threonine/homoserine/homoserine lactone efflux protein